MSGEPKKLHAHRSDVSTGIESVCPPRDLCALCAVPFLEHENVPQVVMPVVRAG